VKDGVVRVCEKGCELPNDACLSGSPYTSHVFRLGCRSDGTGARPIILRRRGDRKRGTGARDGASHAADHGAAAARQRAHIGPARRSTWAHPRRGYRHLRDGAIEVNSVLYAGYDELISMKAATGRDEDLRDIGALEAARRAD
jgi:hypothetical protein